MRKLFATAFAVLLLVGCGSEEKKAAVSEQPQPTGPTYKGVKLLQGNHTVVISTKFGDIKAVLDANIAPMAVTNFVQHAQNGYYDRLRFIGAKPNFIIQGGDKTQRGVADGGDSIWGQPFGLETNNSIKMERGVIAMAGYKKQNESQFFIMLKEDGMPEWNGNFTIFGKVVEGLEVADKISAMPKNTVAFSVKTQ